MKTAKLLALLAAAGLTCTAAAGFAQSETSGGAAAPNTPTVEVPAQGPTQGPSQGPSQGQAKGAEKPEDQVLRKRLVFLLSGYEYFPSRADLDKVAEAEVVTGHLRAIATDADGRPTLRLRAVDALGYYDDAETVALLETLVERPTKALEPKAQRVEGLVRHHAMTSLARARGPEALPKLEPFLEAGDLQLKLTAISALGKFGGDDARQRLVRLRQGAKDPVVLRELRKHLGR